MIPLTSLLLILGFVFVAAGIYLFLRPSVEDAADFSMEAESHEAHSNIGIGFFEQVETLPEEYWDYFVGDSDDRFIIPRVNSAVGDMRITLTFREVNVQVGEHTEAWFPSTTAAFAFVRNVLTDEIVFRIEEEETRYYPIDEFEKPADAQRNDYVWSGPLRYKLMG